MPVESVSPRIGVVDAAVQVSRKLKVVLEPSFEQLAVRWIAEGVI